jgi:hypothetical protein
VASGTGGARPFQTTRLDWRFNISLTYYVVKSSLRVRLSTPRHSWSRSLAGKPTAFSFNGGSATVSHVLQSTNVANVALGSTWQNGWADLSFPLDAGYTGSHSLNAPTAATTIIDINGGSVVTGQNATYFGLPIVGFAVQSYSTTGLPGVNPNVVSNYGGNFNHKYLRDIR